MKKIIELSASIIIFRFKAGAVWVYEQVADKTNLLEFHAAYNEVAASNIMKHLEERYREQ